MDRHVLVAYDETPQSERALKEVATIFPKASITLLTVLDPMEGFLEAFGTETARYERWRENEESNALTRLEAHRSIYDSDTTVNIDTVVGPVPRSIIEYAVEHDVDHIVIGSHGRSGVSRILLGSVAETVVRRSPVSVTVIR